MKKFLIIISIIVIIGVIIALNLFLKTNNSKTISYMNKNLYQSSNNESLSLENVWCGSFQLVWNELKDYYGRNIEFANDNPVIIGNLNNHSFSKKDISDKDYYVILADLKKDKNIKDEIKQDIEKKFGIKDFNSIDMLDTDNSNGLLLFSMINKEFKYIHSFDYSGKIGFYNIDTNDIDVVKCFGTFVDSSEKVYENVELLYYEDISHFVLKLNTKNNEEIYLYRNDDSIKETTLNNLYKEMNEKIDKYDGSIKIKKGDIIKIPEISIDYTINYGELCGKEIVGTNGEYITNAIQNISVNLDSNGGKVKSDASIMTDYMSSFPLGEGGVYILDYPFAIFIKEKNKDNPYLMTRITNSSFLIKE